MPVYAYVDLDAGEVRSVLSNDDGIALVEDKPITDMDNKPLDPEQARRAIEIAESEDWPDWGSA